VIVEPRRRRRRNRQRGEAGFHVNSRRWRSSYRLRSEAWLRRMALQLAVDTVKRWRSSFPSAQRGVARVAWLTLAVDTVSGGAAVSSAQRGVACGRMAYTGR